MTDDEAEIRRMIKEWSQALEARDLDRLTANYAPDVRLFDAIPPYETRGIAAYRKLWEACLPCFPASFESRHRDLEVSVGGDVAFVHGLHRIRPREGDHPAGQTWLRVAWIKDPDAGSAG